MSSHTLRFAERHSHALDSKVHIGSRCFRAAASRRQAYRRRTTQIRAQEEPEQKKGKGLFSFVTDNPSSQNASVASCRNADGSSTAAAASMQKITCTTLRHSGVTCIFTTGAAPQTQAIYQDSPETSEVGAVGRRTKEKVG